MRCCQLPPHLSLCTAPCQHWVVLATNTSESYRAFLTSFSTTTTTSNNAACLSTPVSLARFRLDHLLPTDWCALLHMCRSLTRPDGCYNFSSPGDVSATEELHDSTISALSSSKPSSNATKATHIHNTAFMHIVERIPGDFVPNNMIYHELQQRFLVRSEEGNVDDFSAWLHHAQKQFYSKEIVRPNTLRGEGKGEGEEAKAEEGNNSGGNDRAMGEDPLAHVTAALEKSAQNEGAFSSKGAHRGGLLSHFTFFPHAVCVADCIPYSSRHFVVMVNLKPIVPGHLMVVPIRCVGTIHALTPEELEDWGHVMHKAICVLRHYPSTREGGLSIAIQQGALAGQTVAHLHTHVIPFDPRGKLAGEPEQDEEEQRRRPPRTADEMRSETEALRPLFDSIPPHRL